MCLCESERERKREREKESSFLHLSSTPPSPSSSSPLIPPSSQVDDDASPEAIKTAYRDLAKTCHPDVNSDGHALCILLNEAYETLSSFEARELYNAQLQASLDAAADDYTGKPLSKWLVGHKRGKAKPGETRAVFVDELSCIGCKNCIFEAAATFRVEREHGRARVFAQWLDDEAKIQRSIDSCPVSCIHWVEKEDLPALEHVTQKVLTGELRSLFFVFEVFFSFRLGRDEKRKKLILSLSPSLSPPQHPIAPASRP